LLWFYLFSLLCTAAGKANSSVHRFLNIGHFIFNKLPMDKRQSYFIDGTYLQASRTQQQHASPSSQSETGVLLFLTATMIIWRKLLVPV
jgi:hypothetical protein